MARKADIDVSVVIVNFNQAEMTRACLQSVLKHSSGVAIELIVVDNSDVERLDTQLSEFEGLILIKNPSNLGFAAANNLGLDVATGRFVLFLNNDTLFIESTLPKLIRFYDSLPTRALIGCKLLNEDGSHQFSTVDFNTRWNQFGEYAFLSGLFPRSKRINKFHANVTQPDEIRKTDVVKGAFILGNTEDVLALNGFDEAFFFYNEEDDLCQRFKHAGGDVWYYPETAIIHFGGATTATLKWFSIFHQHRSKLIYFRKHAQGLDYIAYLSMHLLGYAVRVPLYIFRGLLTLNSTWVRKGLYYGRCLFLYPSSLRHD